nr:cobyric acid synthase [Ardenticatena sp.]
MPLAPVLMIQGTHSNAGKSLMVTALCRIFARRGLRVAPFKAQNMALNSFVTPEGAEIGRAQAVQAEAAGIAPHVDMNPILIKPEGDGVSQLVLNGRPYTRLHAGNFYALKAELWPHVTAALDRLRARFDLVIAEGAGSPAEINLKAGDIVNMRVARYANAPVLLVGDIDRGGVFAALVGTMVLLEPEERALVKGFIINKFRGDLRLLGDGLEMLRERAFGVPTLGVVPFLPNLRIADEDSVALETRRITGEGDIEIVVVQLPRISNFDDFDALAAEPGVRVRFIQHADEIGSPHALILPGSKATIADVQWLYETGIATRVQALAADGIPVVGICGGYQMLGQWLEDTDGVEAPAGTRVAGLGLLPTETRFAREKATFQVRISGCQGTLFEGIHNAHGYEIHMGRTQSARPLFRLKRSSSGEEVLDGAVHGHVWGTYVHGLFDNVHVRQRWLRTLGWRAQGKSPAADWREYEYDRLADHVAAHVDIEAIARLVKQTTGHFL